MYLKNKIEEKKKHRNALTWLCNLQTEDSDWLRVDDGSLSTSGTSWFNPTLVCSSVDAAHILQN